MHGAIYRSGRSDAQAPLAARPLQDWEQGRREPSGAAKTLLRIAARTPEAIKLVA